MRRWHQPVILNAVKDLSPAICVSHYEQATFAAQALWHLPCTTPRYREEVRSFAVCAAQDDSALRLNVETELHHVAVTHDVFLAFDPQLSRLTRFREGTE